MILYLSSEVQVPQNSILAIVDSLVDECKEPITESSDMLLKNSDFGADHLELFEVIQQSCEFVSSLLKGFLILFAILYFYRRFELSNPSRW